MTQDDENKREKKGNEIQIHTVRTTRHGPDDKVNDQIDGPKNRRATNLFTDLGKEIKHMREERVMYVTSIKDRDKV